jgi:hypothetical protein
MKTALPGSEELLEKLLAHLGPNRLPRLIGIDGDVASESHRWPRGLRGNWGPQRCISTYT